MGGAGVAGRKVEAGLVGAAGADRLGHLVVDFEDDAFGVVLAEALFVFALDDRKGLHDVVSVIAQDAIEMEERGIKFASDEKAAFLVPSKRRPVVAKVTSKSG